MRTRLRNAPSWLVLLFFLSLLTALRTQAQTWQWATKAGGRSYDGGHTITTDATGNVYVAGAFTDTATFGSTTVLNTYNDIFVAKYTAAGVLTWVAQTTSSTYPSVQGIAVDGSGNVYICGTSYQSSTTFGAGVAVPTGGFVARLSSAGAWTGAWRAGERAEALAIDASGSVYVTGIFSGSVGFGTISLTSSGLNDVFVGKLAPSTGTWAWVKSGGSTDTDNTESGQSIVTDGTNVFLLGYFSSSFPGTFGTFTVPAGNGNFIAKLLASSGAWQWADPVGVGDYMSANALARDGSGNLYISGVFSDVLSFGATTLLPQGYQEAFVTKFNSSTRSWTWAAQTTGSVGNWGGSTYTELYSVALDNSGNVVVGGSYGDTTLTVGTVVLPSAGQQDAFVAKLNASTGNWMWAVRGGGAKSDGISAVACDASGNVCVTGSFSETAIFGTVTLNATGANSSGDILIAKLSNTSASPPTVTSFTPTSGSAGTVVTVTGSNFTGATSVRFNGVEASSFTVGSASSLTATVSLAATTGKISVQTPSGTGTSANNFTVSVPAPTVSSFTPTSGCTSTVVTLTGTNFSTVTAVKLGTTALPYTLVSPTTISVTIPFGATTGAFSVTTAGGTAQSSTNFLITGPPTITNTNPTTGGAGTVVTLTGTNLTSVTAVTLGGTAAAFTMVNATTLNVTVPTGANSSYFYVTTACSSSYSNTTFTVIPLPAITNFTPTSGGDGVVVTLTGSNFGGATTVKFNGADAADFTVSGTSQITATVPVAATTGPISVTTPGGTGTSTAAFTVQTRLVVTAINPTRNQRAAARTSDVTVTLSGAPLSGTIGNVLVHSAQRGGRKSAATTLAANTITVNPTVDFRAGEKITVVVPSTVTSVAGVGVRRHVYQFTTATATATGTFTGSNEVSATNPVDVALGDLDGDGDLDMASINNGQNLTINLNDGAGAYTYLNNYTLTYSGSAVSMRSVTLGDVDNDGDLDAAVTGISSGSLIYAVFMNNGAAGFFGTLAGGYMATGSQTFSGDLADVNGDGYLDLLLADYNGNTVLVAKASSTGLLNGYTTGAPIPVGTQPGSLVTGDIDNDGDMDFLTANEVSNTVSVRLNNGYGGFTSVPDVSVGAGPISVTLGDVDGDGDLDILTANYTANTVSVRLNSGTGTFTGSTEVSVNTGPYELVLGDIDGDSDLDLLTCSFATNGSIRRNAGNGTFSGTVSLTVPASRSLALGDVNGDNTADVVISDNTNGKLFIRLNQPATGTAPTITSFTPPCGLGGTTVSITGTGFTGATAVAFNGTSANFSVNTATSITATIPTNATTGPITVTTAAGTGMSAASFTPAPATPTATGNSRCGTGTVTLTASGAPAGGSYKWYTVATGGTPISGATAGSYSTPSLATTTTYYVSCVSSTGCESARQAVTATVNPAPAVPTGVSATPSSLPLGQSTALAISAPIAGITYTWTRPGQTTITGASVSATPATTGNVSYTVTATNAAGCVSAAVTVTVTVTAASTPPTVTSFTPTSAAVGASVTIAGTNFTGTTSVTFGGVPATTVVVNSATSITATVPATAVTGVIGVTTPGGTGTSAASFKVLPTISSFSPTSGAPGTLVAITGTGLLGATFVKFNSVSATSFTVVNSTTITVTVPATATTGKISVTTAGSTATSTGTFTVGPIVTSFLPARGAPGSVVLVQGLNFVSGTTVKINGVSAATTYNSATQLTAIVPASATSGLVTATNTTGTGTSTTNFTVVSGVLPTITSFTPTANVIVGTTITITGTNFTGATLVRFNNVSATVKTVNSATSITATVPAGATTGKIYVATPSGMCQSAASLTIIPAPTITTLSPTSGAVGSVVLLGGTNLTGASSVLLNGVAVPFTVNSATQIVATIPAGATTGKFGVTTIAGTGQSTGTFTISAGPAPTITNLSATSGIRGASVIITGTNFTGVTSVKLGTVTCVYTLNSSTQLTATVPSTATTGRFYVTTSAGGMAQSATYTVIVAPTISSFTPATGPVGTLVTINGTNFAGIMAVRFGGVAATSYTVVSTAKITATVPMGAVTGQIQVVNAAGTATSTNTFTLTTARTSAVLPANPAVPLTLVLYPNPATAVVTLEATGLPAEATADLLDALGRVVRTYSVREGVNRLALGEAQPGLYVIRLGGQQRRLIIE